MNPYSIYENLGFQPQLRSVAEAPAVFDPIADPVYHAHGLLWVSSTIQGLRS